MFRFCLNIVNNPTYPALFAVVKVGYLLEGVYCETAWFCYSGIGPILELVRSGCDYNHTGLGLLVYGQMALWEQGSDKDAVIKLSWVIAGFFLMPVGILILQGYLGFGYAALISVPIGLVWVISAWVVISWLNIVKADEVALLYFFGNIRKRRLTSGNGIRFLGKSGLHFVPWFPGISLLRFPKDLKACLKRRLLNNSGAALCTGWIAARAG